MRMVLNGIERMEDVETGWMTRIGRARIEGRDCVFVEASCLRRRECMNADPMGGFKHLYEKPYRCDNFEDPSSGS